MHLFAPLEEIIDFFLETFQSTIFLPSCSTVRTTNNKSSQNAVNVHFFESSH